jgi:hypothetical protein
MRQGQPASCALCTEIEEERQRGETDEGEGKRRTASREERVRG